MDDENIAVVFVLSLSELRLLYSLCSGTLKIPKSKKKLGKENYSRLSLLRDAFKVRLDELEAGEKQK